VVWRGISKAEREEETGGWRRLHNKQLYDLSSSANNEEEGYECGM
jgi:hypothetical protein